MQNEVTFPQSVAGENVTVKRATWKNHGNPTTGWYWGTETPTAGKATLVQIFTHKGLLKLTDAETGRHITGMGFASKFWLSEAAGLEFEQSPVLVQLKADTADKPAKVELKELPGEVTEVPAKTTKSKKVSVACPCVCGGMTKPGKTFIQGHDAKLSAKLFAEVGKGRVTAEGAIAVMAAYSDVLAAKLAARIAKSGK